MKKYTFKFLAFILLCVPQTLLHAQKVATSHESDYILFITSINFSDEWSNGVYKHVKSSFENKIDIRTEELMVPFIHTMDQVKQVQSNLIAKHHTPPKMVILIGDPGWIVTRPLFDKEWKDVPVLISFSRSHIPKSIEVLISPTKGMDSLVAKSEMIKGYNVTTIDQSFFITETINMMQQLMPQMNNIVFIHDDRYISLIAKKELSSVIDKSFPNLELEFLSSPEITSEQLLEKITSYDSRVGIIYYSWFIDQKSIPLEYVSDNIQKILFGFAKTPVFTLSDQNPQNGNFAGGYYVSMSDVNNKIVSLVKGMLDKGSAQGILHIDSSKATKYLNYHHLQHHNIDPILYPKDAVYFQMPPTLFQKYKVRIITISSAFILILVCGIFWAVIYVQKQKQHEHQFNLSAKYRNLVKNMPVGYMRKQLIRNSANEVVDFIFIDINPAFEKAFACEQDKVLNKTLSELIDLYPSFEYFISNHQDSHYAPQMGTLTGDDSQAYYDLLEFSDDNSNIIDIFLIDNTYSHQVQLKTEEYHYFLQSILDNLPMAAKVNDINNNLNCIYWNQKAEELFQVSTNEVIGKTELEYLSKETAESIKADMAEILNTGKNSTVIKNYTLQGGAEHTLLVSRTAITYSKSRQWLLSSALDISEIQESRTLMESLNEKYQLVLRATGMTILVWDLVKKSIYCNTEYSDMNALHVQDGKFTIEEEEYFTNVHPDNIHDVREAFDQLIAGTTDIIEQDYRIKEPFRDVYQWITGYATIGRRDEQGKPTSIVGAIKNIAQQKELEEDLMKAKEQADESNRLKSAFLANMSHEIRTPLNAIVGFSGLLADTYNEEDRKEYVHIIENNNTLLLQLINDILDISKIEANSLEFIYSDVDIKDMFKDIEQSALLRINGDKVQLIMDENLPDLVISSDRNRLMQVITNFVTNAIKFTHNGSIKIGYKLQNDNTVYFYVSDTGHGIKAESLNEIFGRFVKLNAFEQGTGLGLSICETIVKRLGGQIGVDSDFGVGSTFWFTITNTKPESEESLSHPILSKRSGIANNRDITILIAEDNTSNYKLFESILKRDYNIIHAWNGHEAVEMFKEHNPTLILMDINMPIMNGYQATEEIRKLSDDTIIVAITAHAFAKDQQQVYKRGFNEYISKPINNLILKNKIANLLNK